MRTLHIAPGDSAAGSLRQALRIAGRDDELLAFRDDLSCGPGMFFQKKPSVKRRPEDPFVTSLCFTKRIQELISYVGLSP